MSKSRTNTALFNIQPALPKLCVYKKVGILLPNVSLRE